MLKPFTEKEQIIVHSGTDLPQRVMFAWSVGAQDKLIADANVIDDHLFVLSCATDPQWQAAVAAQSIEYDTNFGKAVAALRKELGPDGR